MSHPRHEAGAIVLTATLSSAIESRSFLERHLAVPAVIRQSRDYRPPLDLDAPRFRYEIAAGKLRVAKSPARRHACRAAKGRQPAGPK